MLKWLLRDNRRHSIIGRNSVRNMNKAGHILHHLYGIVQRFAWYYRRILEYSIVIRIYCDRLAGTNTQKTLYIDRQLAHEIVQFIVKSVNILAEFIWLDGEFSVSLIVLSIDRNNLCR